MARPRASKARERRPSPRFVLGAELEERRGRVVVKSVVGRSPAAQARLARGDVLAAIGRREVESLDAVAASLRRTSDLLVLRADRRSHRTIRPVDLSSARDSAAFLLGVGDEELYKGKIKLGSTCRNGSCADGSMWSWCYEYYSAEGDGPHGGILLLRHCFSHDMDTKRDRRSADPNGPKEFF